MLEKKVKDYIEAHAEETYELLVTLAKIPSPSNHEERRAEFCREWLKAQGAEGVFIDEALNVVYPFEMSDEKPVIVFMAHTDVVFPDKDELPMKVEDGKLYCPGVGDDTANLAAMLLAAKYVTENNIKTKECGILFVCNSGEEGLGNLKGSRKIYETYGKRIREFYSFDGYIEKYTNCAVGSNRYKVIVKTIGGHSYAKFGNPNAIALLSDIIHDLYKVQVPDGGKTTYNVGLISGGTSVNTIAQQAEMLYEFRSDKYECLQKMEQLFNEVIAKHREKGTDISVEIMGMRPCEKDVDEKIRTAMFKKAEQAVYNAAGILPEGSSGSTDCNIPLSMGIPSVCLGTCSGNGAHTREEYVEIDSLKQGYQIALEIILDYCRI